METSRDVDRFFGVAPDGKGRFVIVGRDRVVLASTDNGLTWGLVQSKSNEKSIFKAEKGTGKKISIILV